MADDDKKNDDELPTIAIEPIDPQPLTLEQIAELLLHRDGADYVVLVVAKANEPPAFVVKTRDDTKLDAIPPALFQLSAKVAHVSRQVKLRAAAQKAADEHLPSIVTPEDVIARDEGRAAIRKVGKIGSDACPHATYDRERDLWCECDACFRKRIREELHH